MTISTPITPSHARLSRVMRHPTREQTRYTMCTETHFRVVVPRTQRVARLESTALRSSSGPLSAEAYSAEDSRPRCSNPESEHCARGPAVTERPDTAGRALHGVRRCPKASGPPLRYCPEGFRDEYRDPERESAPGHEYSRLTGC